MPRVSGLVLPSRNPSFERRLLGGLHLRERAIRALHRAGLDHIVVVAGQGLDDPDLPGRLARDGVGASMAQRDLLAALPEGDAVVIVSADMVFEPRALGRLLACADGDTTHGYGVKDPAGGVLAYLPPAVLATVRGHESVDRALCELDGRGVLVSVDLSPLFCRPFPIGGAAWRFERDYIRARNGPEGVFTRIIRLFSVPVSQLLLRLHVSANQVTLVGLALSLLAALQFAERSFWPGVFGALTYYASMVLDCCDGEVARATFTDSKFGAWLETISDYLSYFFVLGGLVAGELRYQGFCTHVEAAIVAAALSFAIVLIVGRLRHTVAAANPGAFDDALASTLGQGSPIERFAVATRSLIKRSFLAHLIVFMSLIGHLPALLYVWAHGAAAALMMVLAIKGSLARQVRVEAIRGTLDVTQTEERQA